MRRSLSRAGILALLLTASFGLHAQPTFSCQINGQTWTNTGGDSYSNACIKTAADIINIGLVSTDAKYKGHVPPQFIFYIKPSGATSLKNNSGKYSVKYSMANAIDDDYVPGNFTVTITSYSPAHVTGTFSGTLSDPKHTITVSNGKFDVPVSPYSNIK